MFAKVLQRVVHWSWEFLAKISDLIIFADTQQALFGRFLAVLVLIFGPIQEFLNNLSKLSRRPVQILDLHY